MTSNIRNMMEGRCAAAVSRGAFLPQLQRDQALSSRPLLQVVQLHAQEVPLAGQMPHRLWVCRPVSGWLLRLAVDPAGPVAGLPGLLGLHTVNVLIGALL